MTCALKFVDTPSSGALQALRQPALAGWGVFLDTNHNGVYDAGVDVRVVSDANGNYTFGNLAPETPQ